jgi:hypothetical protein
LLAGVLDAAAPPNRLDPLVLLVAPPKRLPLLGALDVLLLLLFAVPKRDGVAPPVDGVAPKRDLLGVLLLPLPLFCWPNEKAMLAPMEGRRWWVDGCLLKELSMQEMLSNAQPD